MPEGHTIHRLARQQQELFGRRTVGVSSPQGRFADGAYILDGRVLTRTRIYDHVWDERYDGHSNTLEVHVMELRRKLEVDPARPRHLLTEPGMGYRFQPQES